MAFSLPYFQQSIGRATLVGSEGLRHIASRSRPSAVPGRRRPPSMSAFPIVPRAGGARVGSSAPAGSSFVMPTLDLGKISFASMGGSAAPVVLPENDDPYDVDSSDEDLDGMEAAVAMHEARRARREELDAARSANAAAREAVEREAREARRAVEALRAQRRRFEDARCVGVLTTAKAADEETRELDELRARRERVDARIDALLRDDERRGREARDDPAADAKAKTVDEFDDVDARELPRWKRRREARWAEEARRAAAALEARDPGGTSDAAFARSSSVRSPFEDRTRASPSDVCARARAPSTPTTATRSEPRSSRAKNAETPSFLRRVVTMGQTTPSHR